MVIQYFTNMGCGEVKSPFRDAIGCLETWEDTLAEHGEAAESTVINLCLY